MLKFFVNILPLLFLNLSMPQTALYAFGIPSHLWRLGHAERDNLFEPLASGDFENRFGYHLKIDFEPRFSGPHLVVLRLGTKTLRNNTAKEPFIFLDGEFNVTVLSEGKIVATATITKWGKGLLWKDQDGRTDFDFIGEKVLCEMDLKAKRKYSLRFDVLKRDSRMDDKDSKVEVRYSYYD